MERPTKTIELPVSKKSVVICEWINGREKRKIGSETINDNQKIDLMIETLVLSVDGKKENLVEVINDMHGKDFDFLFIEITSIIEASSLPVEKKSE